MKETKDEDFIRRFIEAGETQKKRGKKRKAPVSLPNSSQKQTVTSHIEKPPAVTKSPVNRGELRAPENEELSDSSSSSSSSSSSASSSSTRSSSVSTSSKSSKASSVGRISNSADRKPSPDVPMQTTATPRGTPYIKDFAGTKFTLVVNGSRIGPVKRAHQFASDSSSDDSSDSLIILPHSSSKRLRRDPRVCFKSILENVVGKILAESCSLPFRKPVDARQVPDYYQIVCDPIDLKTIATKVQDEHYKTSKHFLDDIKRLLDNSTLYNGEESIYTEAAKQIYQLADQTIREKAIELAEYESAINGSTEPTNSDSENRDPENTMIVVEKCKI